MPKHKQMPQSRTRERTTPPGALFCMSAGGLIEGLYFPQNRKKRDFIKRKHGKNQNINSQEKPKYCKNADFLTIVDHTQNGNSLPNCQNDKLVIVFSFSFSYNGIEPPTKQHKRKGRSNMDAMQIYSQPLTTEMQQTLARQFIAYIDRGEKTTQTYITNLRQFFAYLQQTGCRQPNRNTIIAYRDYLLAERKPNTAKQYLQSVRQFFAWTAAEGLYPNIASNVHCPKVTQNTHKKEALRPADVLRIENSIKEQAEGKTTTAEQMPKDTAGRTERATEQGKRMLAIYTLAVNCGLRCIEISRANCKDFETIGGISYLYIWGKGHTEADQRKALAPGVAEILQDYLNSRTDKPTGNSPLFVATGNRNAGGRILPGTISKMIKRELKAAGYNSERITAHSLRHTAGTNVQELTGNIYTTQQYMRHCDPKTTEIYLHTNNERQELETANKLYALYHSGETERMQ